MPAVAAALLAVGAALALVLDRLWIDAAALELRAAAEAAALAGAARLAGDERLRGDVDVPAWHQSVRDRAADVAAQNRVAGSPVQISRDPGVDILIGQMVRDAGGNLVFLETSDANAVAVLAQRTRSRSNPLALLLQGVSGQESANVAEMAEASIDNRVVGVRPIDGAAVPMFPLAILETDPLGIRTDTWAVQIEQRAGADVWTFDEDTIAVRPGPDGIPEIVLRSARSGADAQEQLQANVRCVDIGNRLGERAVTLQTLNGITNLDLAPWGGALRFDQGQVALDSTSAIGGGPQTALRQLIGQPRIWLLYASTGEASADAVVTATRLVAGRVMAVASGSEGEAEIVLQPCVLTTRTAELVDSNATPDEAERFANPYIYKLHLTQ